jgi:hypothetical protein
MGRDATAHAGGELAGAVQEHGSPPDQQYAPLPADADPDRAWIEEGLRRALARAAMGELSALAVLLTVESGCPDSLAGWLKTLVADEMDRRVAPPGAWPQPPLREAGKGGSASGDSCDRLPRCCSGQRSATATK